jgi:hypothetical protein
MKRSLILPYFKVLFQLTSTHLVDHYSQFYELSLLMNGL